jgi:hypothetical protein
MLIIGRRDKDDHETAARPAFIYSSRCASIGRRQRNSKK